MNTVSKAFKIFSMAAFAAILSIGTASAQADSEITDEHITAYIIVMDSVDVLKNQIQEEISTKIKEHELLDGGRAYQTIQNAKGDTVKLAEEGITDEQLAAYKAIQEEMEKRTAALNDKFVSMVKEKVGAAQYNDIKKGLRTDPELKERYDAIEAKLEEKEKAGGEATSQNTESVN